MFGQWKTANCEVKGTSLVLDKPLIVCDLGQVFFYLLEPVSTFIMDIRIPVLQGFGKKGMKRWMVFIVLDI